jgi:hypothetical protein
MEQAEWVVRYEAMRALVTGDNQPTTPVQGLVAGWMRVWTSLPPASPKYRHQSGSDERSNSNMVSILLEMAIQAATCQEVTT